MLVSLPAWLVALTVVLATQGALASPCEAPSASPEPAQAAFGGAVVGSVLAAHARLEAGPRPAVVWVGAGHGEGAWYCPGRDVIAVSLSLLDYAWRGRATDGADLLAFVIAHELAHRRFDPPASAARFAGSSACPTDEVAAAEARADERASFLLALAHNPFTARAFSPFALERRGSVESLLVHEHGWSPACQATRQRAAALARAADRMAELGAMYEAATLLAFAPDAGPGDGRAIALALLDHMARSSDGPWAPLPELDLLRAVVHLDRAQSARSWCPPDLAQAGLTPDPCAWTCAVPFPAHAALSPFDNAGRRASSSIVGAAELARARALLASARARGLHPAQVDGVEVCLSFAEAAPERGLALLRRADPREPRVAEALSLLKRQRALLSASAPLHTEAWYDELGLAGPPDPPPPTEPPALPDPSPCEPTHSVALPGWHLSIGRGCLTADGPLTRLLVRDAPAGGPLAPWLTHCALTRAGFSDDGARVQGARCPGDSATWLIQSKGARVSRLSRVDWQANGATSRGGAAAPEDAE